MLHDRVPVSTPPKFCSYHGTQLEDHRSDLPNGFDMFTGLDLGTRAHITRKCPRDGCPKTWVLMGDEWVAP